MLTFTFSYILILIAITKSVFTYYPRIMVESSTGDFIRCLYWAIAIMGFLFTTLHAALSIWNLIVHNKPAIISCLIDHNCSVLSDAKVYKDEVFTELALIIFI